jgi:hypothetical protein
MMSLFKQHITNILQFENYFYLKLEQIQSRSINEHDLETLLGEISKQKKSINKNLFIN